MDQKTGKPLIFISSTIFDFKDLRSSLKYFLEESGYKVALSEFNDFYVDHKQDNFHNCLKQIDEADYFILFVGHRRGSWFKENSESITQHEYHHALELQRNGKSLIILHFVRKELWDVRKDRKNIIDYFTNRNTQLDEIFKIPSEIYQDDPEFIFNFLDEIGKKEEEIIAIKAGDKFPKNNWIYSFDTFHDIAQALETTFVLKTNRRRELLKPLLKQELQHNLTNLFDNYSESGAIYPIYSYIKGLPTKFSIEDYMSGIKIKIKDLKLFTKFIIKFDGISFQTNFINEALLSGEFLDYDPMQKEFQLSKFFKILRYIYDEINRFQIYRRNHFSLQSYLIEVQKIFEKNNEATGNDNILVKETILSPITVTWLIWRMFKPIHYAIRYLEGEDTSLNSITDDELILKSNSGKDMLAITYIQVKEYLEKLETSSTMTQKD